MTQELPIDERATVLAARDGDRQAFGALVRCYQHRAYAAAYSLVKNREDALELAQEAFVRAYRAMDRFDPAMPFYPWLYRIIKNACLNHLKKKQRHGEVSLSNMMESGYDPKCGNDGPVESAMAGDTRLAIEEAMQRLTPQQREILRLRHFMELSYVEIAECLGIPKGTVMSRLHAARKALRAELEQDQARQSSEECTV